MYYNNYNSSSSSDEENQLSVSEQIIKKNWIRILKEEKNTIPVVSYGIIAYTKNQYPKNKKTIELLKLQEKYEKDNGFTRVSYEMNKRFKDISILLVQRTSTMAYNDLIRSRYFFNNTTNILKTYMGEITVDEREKIRNKTFDELWEDMWFNHNSKRFKNDYKRAKYKFSKLNISELLDYSKSVYLFPELGFPKGRLNRESEMDCAIREFNEETGYKRDDYDILNISPLEEVFQGTNNILYKHVYYLARMKDDISMPQLHLDNIKQCEEIKNVDFFNYKESIRLMRPYDVSKKYIIDHAFEIFKNVLE